MPYLARPHPKSDHTTPVTSIVIIYASTKWVVNNVLSHKMVVWLLFTWPGLEEQEYEKRSLVTDMQTRTPSQSECL